MKEKKRNPSQSDVSLFQDIVLHLDIVVLEREAATGTFRLHGISPAWWHQFADTADATTVDLSRCSPFLQEYVAAWLHMGSSELSIVEKSGPWTESDGQGGTMTLEAGTLSIGSRQLLFIERMGSGFEQMHTIVQRARERVLAEEVAVKSHRKVETHLLTQLEASEQTKDDLLALLQHLHLAALVLNEQGIITFASHRSLELLGIKVSHVIGLTWESVLHVREDDRAMIHEMIRKSLDGERTRVVHIERPRPIWIELEIHRDPDSPSRRILVLHDRTELHALRQALNEQTSFHDLVGKSSVMLRTYQLVRDVARVDTTVLIEGETGTGKELIARAIHCSSERQRKPFIAANCAGLTDSILTSQLFGHKRGAFTGAVSDQQGLFEAADGGTLFLDEIGDIPQHVQTALLRVLQEKEITRLGEAKPRKVNVRVVAATHHNLSEDVIRGTFRADLLYRIRIARISLPPLRERREDIPLLAQSFLGQISTATGKSIDRLSSSTLHLLMSYVWPGNVRELKSAIEFAVISCKGKDIIPDDLPPEITDASAPSRSPVWVPLAGGDEKSRLLAALSDAKGNRTEAARRLGVSRATFYRRLVELNIQSR